MSKLKKLPTLRKAELIEHLGEFHGSVRSVMPLDDLARWSSFDLRREHERLASLGPCSLVES